MLHVNTGKRCFSGQKWEGGAAALFGWIKPSVGSNRKSPGFVVGQKVGSAGVNAGSASDLAANGIGQGTWRVDIEYASYYPS
jgi:hypothetical protein